MRPRTSADLAAYFVPYEPAHKHGMSQEQTDVCVCVCVCVFADFGVFITFGLDQKQQKTLMDDVRDTHTHTHTHTHEHTGADRHSQTHTYIHTHTHTHTGRQTQIETLTRAHMRTEHIGTGAQQYESRRWGQ